MTGKKPLMKEERFLYCFLQRVPGALTEQFDPETSTVSSSALSSLPEGSVEPLTAKGLNGGLETVCYRDLVAVASRWEGKDLDDKGVFGEYSQRYQQVNLSLMKEGTVVVPFRFGSIASSCEEIEDLMARVYVQVQAAMERLRGKVELVVQLFWDVKAVLQELKAEPCIQRALNEPAQDRLKVGKMLFQLAEARRLALTSEVHKRLAPLSQGAWDGTCKGEEMIMNRSYLVERQKEPLFDQAVDKLQEDYQGRLSFKYIGPLPPYSFVDIEFNKGNFEVIERARGVLGLPERATLQGIKSNFRRLSALYHPDAHPGGLDLKAVEKFKEVVKAFQTLTAYAGSCKELLGKEPLEYSFIREDVESIFLSRDRSALRKNL